jgi:hypothetical protein
MQSISPIEVPMFSNTLQTQTQLASNKRQCQLPKDQKAGMAQSLLI